MKFIAISAVIACVMALNGTSAMGQPRDGGLNESRLEEQAAECRSDPACMRMVRLSEARAEQAQREYEAKPWYEKVAGWIFVLVLAAVAIYALLFVLGKIIG